MTTIIIFGAPILLLTIYYFNHLIRRKNEVDNASGSINVMLKNRYDLIPNLVDTVKNYMTYESQILDKLTMMRTQALSSDTSDVEKMKLNNDIGGALKQIMVSVENYPDLKASNNFLQLQESWADIEDRISASRRFFNNAVTDYNNAVASFPGNIFAGMMGYKTKSTFETLTEESQNLKAKDLFVG
ncbi:LemA family protein [Chryseobacterium koreense]|uniref:LemA family protein n=1 Tax=Chryseobacterium koreense CCUG 49689 TaxID=1304281 RepID=A0A0J7IWY0_9FLAO|nr:LemA family protein [Chryseobacterium koreense]KMQ70467.1 LemA family protein [Chryseobacterium koreense CCUG 49689]MBB5334454.1 LemA protein [Chryseobacterium koreense]